MLLLKIRLDECDPCARAGRRINLRKHRSQCVTTARSVQEDARWLCARHAHTWRRFFFVCDEDNFAFPLSVAMSTGG